MLNAQHTEDALDRILDLIPLLRRAHAELRIRHAEDRDGYPTRSSLEGRSGGNVTDDQGQPMPPLSDPVGELVIGLVDVTDDVSRALAEMVRKIQHACRELEGATMDAKRADPPARAKQTLNEAQIWCANHLKYGFHEPLGERPRRGMCRFCEQFERDHGVRPHRRVLEAHDRGRLTDRIVQETLNGKKGA